MRRSLLALSFCWFLLAGPPAAAQSPGNLLRNARFQDDWITVLPQTKNHHWCYASEFFNRRDYNPDTWVCTGSWRWLNSDAPFGQRRLVLQGPTAQVSQRVNWIAVHDERSREGFPDAGGFPGMRPVRSRQPLRLVRDLNFRVRLQGQEVPAGAGTIKVGLHPGGAVVSSEPLGSMVAATVSASAALPQGTFGWRWIEVKLPATAWQRAATAAAQKNPAEKAASARSGLVLPATAAVTIHYQAAKGRVEVEQTELLEAGPESPNLLANGGFEMIDKAGYPVGWGRPVKYRYFPPGHYYIFNTWHNANFDNRGPVAADLLVSHPGRRSLQMIVAAGDEKAVVSAPVVLNQKEARLIEARAWVKTDRLCMLQLDAVNEKGERLDGFNFIHKAPVSIGTDDWRLVRQVFRPRAPLKSIRLKLCARGVNGYTLDDTSQQPQNNVVGTIWWDGISLHESESTAAELATRGVKPTNVAASIQTQRLVGLDLGERMLGDNVLRATLVNSGQADAFTLLWEFTSPSGKKSQYRSAAQRVIQGGQVAFALPYTLTETCPTAYTEFRGKLSLLGGKGQTVASSALWFGTWTTPIDLRLGALYLLPAQKQLVRLNLGLSAATLAKLASVRLEVVRRGSGQVLRTVAIAATPAALAAQRDKIPQGLRGDFRNLLLADLDVSFLPLQPFNDPQRNWLVRASARDARGRVVAVAESPPFCRLAHAPAQPAVQTVTIKDGLFHVNKQPWLAWGACYGHVPLYAGPADPGKTLYRDLHNLPGWNIYDGFTAAPYTRHQNDFNCLRYVAGSVTDPKLLEKQWKDDNLYCSSAFCVPQPVFSLAELAKNAGGQPKLDAYLAFCKTAPMVVSIAPGVEEAFGNFHAASPDQLKGLSAVADALRRATGKPVMVGHGGYWNRFEFEKIPFFDIYDPETEPLYPANLHTDLAPLLKGKDKVIWLRPQMYEDVPFERWRFHAFVELMRGCRGWQTAHGPGDASLFRGLHGELEFMKPIVYSQDAGPKVRIEPWLEHWSRRHGGKTYLIAASTHGITLGQWRWDAAAKSPARRSRVTASASVLRDEANAYGIGEAPETGPSIHGIQYLPGARSWPAGSKLVQWVRLDPRSPPTNLVVLLKARGRWTHAASWGKFDVARLRKDSKLAYWFLTSFYRHARGFLGWDDKLVPRALGYIPDRTTALGALPAPGKWLKLEIPLDKVGATRALLDGVGFLHEGGRVGWGRTTLVGPDGAKTVVWGDSVGPSPARLAHTRIHVAGLKAGTKIRVLFEDRELTAAAGHFIDDFRGQDLYQRYGGGYGVGYGDAPVALHIYEIGNR